AVWPFVTGWVALAQYRYHNAHAGRFALDAIVHTGFDESLGRNPEVLSGRVYKSLDTSVPHQFFATSMVLTPLVRGLLGVDVDAPAGRVRVAPHLPADWDTVHVEHLAVGDARLSLRLTREGRSLGLYVKREGIERGTPIIVEFAPALPLGASRVMVSHETEAPAPGVTTQHPGAVVVRDSATLGDAVSLRASWTGGWELIPPSHAVRIGDRSRALRVVSERMRDTRYVVQLEGRAGATYAVRVRAPGGAPATMEVLPANAPMMPVRMSDPDHDGWVTVTVEFPSQGGDADDYIALSLAFVGRA
ncbi:MAG: hypothetical protein ABIZ91_13155, partial [Gemmatimonadaceae bacterium]